MCGLRRGRKGHAYPLTGKQPGRVLVLEKIPIRGGKVNAYAIPLYAGLQLYFAGGKNDAAAPPPALSRDPLYFSTGRRVPNNGQSRRRGKTVSPLWAISCSRHFGRSTTMATPSKVRMWCGLERAWTFRTVNSFEDGLYEHSRENECRNTQ